MSDLAFSPLNYPPVTGVRDEHHDRAAVRGHAAGYAAGRQQAEQEISVLRGSIESERLAWAEQARAELDSALKSLAEAAAELRARQLPLLASVDQALAGAAIELAEAILDRELTRGEDSAHAALRRALAQAGHEPVLAVRLHPADLEVIRSGGGSLADLPLQPDPTLARGDAVIALPHGLIDARISTTLARMRQALREGAE